MILGRRFGPEFKHRKELQDATLFMVRTHPWPGRALPALLAQPSPVVLFPQGLGSMNIGEALKGWRAIQVPSVGVRDLAKQIGISPTTLCKVENGHHPDDKTLMRIWGWLTYPGEPNRNAG